MKTMDNSSDDGDCQVEAVVTPGSKKTKQARLPFQTLSSDSPVANKKRKLASSPGPRKPKVAKVNTKENSVKKANKTETEEITIDDDDLKEQDKEEKKADNAKGSSKQSNATPDTKKSSKQRTPKTKNKQEPKVQSTSLTKFFKKVDSKEKDQGNETQASTSKNEESKQESGTSNREKSEELLPGKSKDQDGPQKKETSKNPNEETKKSTSKADKDDLQAEEQKDESCDEESKDAPSEEVVEVLSDSDDGKMDVDSDSSSDVDKTIEHEDTDSKDSTKKSTDLKKPTTPSSSKLLDSKTKKLTPKQIEKKLESQKRREEREKQRLEKEKKMQEERENKKKEKEDKKREREEKEKALKEQKQKEKEMKEQKRLAELEQKQKEKEAKEEDRRKREEAKEEEKKKKEEERLEAERKKQKAASNFVSFFVAKKPAETKPVEEEEVKVEKSNFMPFQVKADMRIAPAARRTLSDEEKSKLVKLMSEGVKDKSGLYVGELKSKKFCARKSERTWPVEANDDDVVILEDGDENSSNVVQEGKTASEKHRAKLLLFNENRRPPYWGTWRKKSKSINPRKPFAMDTKWFDYEVDSDEEWEEEEPGESLHGSDDEKDEDTEDNEYDVDNEFMVPHGYLSDEEVMADEEEGEEEEDDDLNPEQQKTKLKMLNEQFEAERKQKTTKLQPKLIGCYWLKADNTYPENIPDYAVRFLTARQAWVREVPVSLTAPADGDLSNENTASSAIKQSARKAENLEAALPDLIRLLHGNTNGQEFLAKEFLVYWSKRNEGKRPLAKIRLKEKIRELANWMACPEPGPMHDKFVWYVPEETRKKYLGDETLSLPNSWTYNLTPKKKNMAKQLQAETKDKQPSDQSEDKEAKKNLPRITQFTKTLTAEEMQKQLAEKPQTSTTPVMKATPPAARPPKRAALISLPREEPVAKLPRVSLIDVFVTKDGLGLKKPEKEAKKSQMVTDDDDGIAIIDDDSNDNNDASVKTESGGMKKSVSADKPRPEEKGDKKDTAQSDRINKETGNTSASSDVEIMEV